MEDAPLLSVKVLTTDSLPRGQIRLPMACCSCATRRCWRWWALIAIALLIGGSAWLYVAMEAGVTGTIVCITSAIQELQSSASSVLAGLPTEYIDTISAYSGYLGALIITPGIVSALVLGLSLVFFCCAAKEGASCSMCMFRFFIVLFDIVALVAFVVFLICGVIGTFVNHPTVTAQTSQFTSICTNELPTLQATLTNLTATKAQMEEAGQDTTDLSVQLTEAQTAYDAFDTMCVCLLSLFDKVQELVAPGFVGAGLVLISFVVANIGCCAVKNDGGGEKDFSGISMAHHRA